MKFNELKFKILTISYSFLNAFNKFNQLLLSETYLTQSKKKTKLENLNSSLFKNSK